MKNSKMIDHVKIKRKTMSRFLAVQSLYQLYFYNFEISIESILDNTKNCYYNNSVQSALGLHIKNNFSIDFITNLVSSFTVNKVSVNEFIDEALKECSYYPDLDQFSVMRAGICELFCFKVNSNIVISEYINIAASILQKNKLSVINAVLDRFAKSSLKNCY